MIFAQVENIIEKAFTFWGPWAFALVLLICALVWMARRNKRLEDERQELMEKSISALLQSQMAMEATQITNKEQAREIRELHNLILQNGCKWQRE